MSADELIKDLYDILGVDKTANKKEIRKQYKSLAQTLHPDREGGDEAEFQLVKYAFEILYDDEAREKYDTTGKVGKEPSNTAMAMSGLAELFVELLKKHINNIETVDLRQEVLLAVDNMLSTAHENASNNALTINKLERVKSKIKAKHHIFESTLVHEIQKLHDQANSLDQQIEVFELMSEMCEDFDYEYESMFAGTTTATGPTTTLGHTFIRFE